MKEQYVVIGSVILAALVYHVPALRAAFKYLRIGPTVLALGALVPSVIVVFTTAPGSWSLGWTLLFLSASLVMVRGFVRGMNDDYTWKV